MDQKSQNKSEYRILYFTLFTLQYLTKNSRYEVEFLDTIKGPRKH